MEKIKVNYTHNHSVARIILDDGKGNILDHVMMEELWQLFDSFKENQNLKLITFEGAGKHFSFGASVEEHQQEFAETMLHGFHQLFYLLRDLAIPTLAIVSGQCLGGGMELTIMCNFIFADSSARFGQPEIVLGVFPPPASVILQEKIGLARAENLLITGKTIPASEAADFGLVNELFDDKTALNSGVEHFIQTQILPKSATSLRFAVKASRMKFNHVLSSFLPQLESLYVKQLMQTHDANEGINSFLEKRKPEWNNA
ncbi:MAG: enoyl-CoA hydratase/isomerase family protein [Bacteroidia bacterium]|nr:enoyl-CoA hydratase/isomerase family protein [Bacteroidia bacterium]MCZ2277547.1 enoyl-CoA hydratase/isomerase family protein [Bacteroidia bacterium]